MKIQVVVIKDEKANAYTAFLKKYPAICTQANNLTSLKNNLQRNIKLFSNHLEKTELDLSSNNVFSY